MIDCSTSRNNQLPTSSPTTPQTDWDLHHIEDGGHPVSRVTINVRWPALAAAHANAIRASLPDGGNVIDIGGGDGRLGHLLGGGCSHYVNLEPSVTILSRLYSGDISKAVRGFGEHLPFRSEVFSCVSSKSSLDHTFDLDMMMSESFRVLRPGGTLVISLVNEASWYKRLLPGLTKQRREHCEDHNFFLGVSDLEILLGRHGFRDIGSTTRDYLRFPIRLENLVFRLTHALVLRKFLLVFDAMCRSMFPTGGGTMIVQATKPQHRLPQVQASSP